MNGRLYTCMTYSRKLERNPYTGGVVWEYSFDLLIQTRLWYKTREINWMIWCYDLTYLQLREVIRGNAWNWSSGIIRVPSDRKFLSEVLRKQIRDYFLWNSFFGMYPDKMKKRLVTSIRWRPLLDTAVWLWSLTTKSRRSDPNVLTAFPLAFGCRQATA